MFSAGLPLVPYVVRLNGSPWQWVSVSGGYQCLGVCRNKAAGRAITGAAARGRQFHLVA
ncbi:hypothetical protein APA386B_1511 [Acetobacter pasteurianus 386B]|nr:hypothetical protein APA386B_1511 [Acetobacter pasteurianus 386B]